MSFEWIVTPDIAFSQLTNAYIARIRAGVRAIAHHRAPEIETWMKDNHLWINRTGAAEAGLHTEVEDAALDIVEIILEGGVDYQIFLELANGGRYAIIAPAVDYWGPVIWRDVMALLS